MYVVEARYYDQTGGELFGIFAAIELAEAYGEHMKATAGWLDYCVLIVHPVVEDSVRRREAELDAMSGAFPVRAGG